MLLENPVRTVALLGTLVFGSLACSSEATPPAKSAANQTESSKTAAASDTDACKKICDASRACGDSSEECTHKCNSWLVERSRTGIARQTATCAVPRIENACAQDASKGAARALVNCVDDAGRTALRKDNKSLVVAAHAICARGARCGGGSQGDAAACVEKIMSSSPMPRGLGIFGATRPEIVKDFASCMDASPCDGSPAACFAGMMGEEVMEGEEPPAQSTPAPSSSGSSGGPDTKI